MINYKKFKSGTDIRGVASEGVANQPIDLTDEVVQNITSGFVVWFCEKSGKNANEITVSVGHDSRISAQRIKTAVIKSLVSVGVSVVDCGLSSTPAMFMSTVEIGCDAAIQITASHHPFNRNGLKFFTKEGGVSASDVAKMLENAQNGARASEAEGSVREYNFMKDYAKILRDKIKAEVGGEQPLKGLKIVVDAGNGAGGFYASDVLAPLGADVTGSQFLEPDGMFPNHIPNPEDEQAMASVSAATVKNGADLGVIFDTDVDRSSCVSSDGKEINRNRIVALAAAIALENAKGGTVVTDSVTSSGLKLFIEDELGGKHHRFKRGYKNVIDESVRLNNEGVLSPLAIETSGHAAFAENYFLDDGAYLVTKIIIKSALLAKEGKTINDLIANLKEPKEEVAMRFEILDDDFKSYGEKVIERLEKYSNEKDFIVADDNHEGIRVSLLSGWFLLRLSVHDPIMPFNIESDEKGDVKKIANEIYPFLKQFDKLNIAKLKEFIK